MKIKNITMELGNDFFAILECEHCGHEQSIESGYHDRYYHNEVIPNMECKECGKKRDEVTHVS